MSARPALPIDPLLDELVATLRDQGRLVLQAPPGAGKTTRVPPALIERGALGEGQLLVLEPRRLAARLAARHVAAELGEPVGQRVGYQVRHDKACGPDTRLLFVTEGLFVRRLLADPLLPGVAGVVLDEFHERHLDSDLALAALQRLRRTLRPDLGLVVMSATLDPGPLATFLDDAPVLRAEGRRYEVAIEHTARDDDRPLERQVGRQVQRLLDEGLDGDVLVFLPGAAEIRRCREQLEPLARQDRCVLRALHGELPAAEQDRALAPAELPRIILSTNVAESSVTVDGVVAVIDSGLARVPGQQGWTGLPSLELRKVSRASCTQRAGRAGRTRPGRCLRLFTRGDHDSRVEQDLGEIQRLELAELVLRQAGLARCAELMDLAWLDPPPAAAWQRGTDLLRRLGALGDASTLGRAGEQMLNWPLHPRLGRMLLEAREQEVVAEACLLAALLSERDILRRVVGQSPVVSGQVASSDVLQRAELFERARRERFRGEVLERLQLHPGAVHAVDRSRRQLQQLLGAPSRWQLDEDREQALLICLLAAFPDRVARRRGERLVLADGGEARLDASSVVQTGDWLLAIDAVAQRRGTHSTTLVRQASGIEPEWLLDLVAERIESPEALRFDEDRERVERISELRYGQLVLEGGASPAVGDPQAAALLAEQAMRRLARVIDLERLQQLRGRLRVLGELRPDLAVPALEDDGLRALLERVALPCADLAALRQLDPLAAIELELGVELGQALRQLCPEQLSLPGRRRCPVEYPDDAPPFVAAQIQELFGLDETPRIGGGALAVQLKLLGPNRRPVQQTQDLAGFWERHYPTLRRELMRRYPRHHWPEDPRSAPAVVLKRHLPA